MNKGLERALDRCLMDSGESFRSSITLEDTEALYTKYMELDIPDISRVTVPVFCATFCKHVLRRANSLATNLEKIVVPLKIFNTSKRYPWSTLDKALEDCFRTTTPYFVGKYQVKDITFYGNRWIILDNDFTPLYAFTKTFEKPPSEYINHIVANYSLSFHEKLLVQTQVPLYKTLIRKVLPFLLNGVAQSSLNDYFTMFTDFKHLHCRCTSQLDENLEPNAILNLNLDTLIKSMDYVF